jgi:hypothetical protein
MTDHPITPPPELVQQWADMLASRSDEAVFSLAAQWGYEQRGEVNEAQLQKARDQELGACCEWLDREGWSGESRQLRAARRPKLLSLKEQALAVLEEAPGPDYPRAMTVLNADQHALIRRALEALPND